MTSASNVRAQGRHFLGRTFPLRASLRLRTGKYSGSVPKQRVAGYAVGPSSDLETCATGVLPHYCYIHVVQCLGVQVSDTEV